VLADLVKNLRGEVKSGGGSSDGAELLGVYGLIAVAIGGGIRAGNVRRKRDVADAIEGGEKIRDRSEADVALAEFRAGQDFSLEFVLLAEVQAFTDADLAAGTDQAFPVIWVGRDLSRQQNFNAAVQEVAGRRITRTDRLSAGALAASIEAGGKNASVIEDHQVTGPQEAREVAKLAIMPFAGTALHVQHPGRVAGSERFLGDQFVGKVEVEL
jgi:hypothetical protein